LDCFDKLEALIESGGVDGVERARVWFGQIMLESKPSTNS
jgi:hypothetical protein